MNKLLIILIMAVIGVDCQKQQQLESTSIKAATMVCGTCAKNVEKAVFHVEGVKEVNVDIKAKIVEVKYVPTQTNLQTIELAITDAGYNANERKRNSDAYDKLDACCKIDN